MKSGTTVTADYRRAVRGALNALATYHGCQICGYRRACCALQFHHLVGRKKFSISQANRYTSMETIVSEVAKCVILCSNCHAEVHRGKICSVVLSNLRPISPRLVREYLRKSGAWE